jgi:hypothetical protein
VLLECGDERHALLKMRRPEHPGGVELQTVLPGQLPDPQPIVGSNAALLPIGNGLGKRQPKLRSQRRRAAALPGTTVLSLAPMFPEQEVEDLLVARHRRREARTREIRNVPFYAKKYVEPVTLTPHARRRSSLFRQIAEKRNVVFVRAGERW